MSLLKRIPRVVTVVAGLLFVSACESLVVSDPNDPDRSRVLASAPSVEALLAGGLNGWMNIHQGMDPDGALTTMADNYTASWNNFQMRIYSSEPRTSWQNDPASSAKVEIESYWYAEYASLAAANAALYAVRTLGVFHKNADSAMVENLAVMLQGMSVGMVALNYDRGFEVEYNSNLAGLTLNTRQQLRDWALAKLDTAIAMAGANTYTWPGSWTNNAGANGAAITNVQVAQIANSMAARILAYFPRAASETQTAAEWDRVAGYASKGISSGTPFDFAFIGDGCVAGGSWCDELRLWSNDMTTMRMDTRVANMMDTSQHTPWPDPGGNPQPNSADRRLGDGTYGTPTLANAVGTLSADAGAGTDYAWSPNAIFRPVRGQYHQSNIGQTRYDYLGFSAPDGSGGGFGFAPVMIAAENDLLLAEGLIRGTAPNLAAAATLINNTRVGRGGLAAAAAGDGVAVLLAKLQYEQDVELPGDGAVPYYNRRRIDGLQPLTPHQMPIPAKELGVLGLALYTFGGASPAFSASLGGTSVTTSSGPIYSISSVRDAPRIYDEMRREQMARIRTTRQ